jgi:hypothetical protein
MLDLPKKEICPQNHQSTRPSSDSSDEIVPVQHLAKFAHQILPLTYHTVTYTSAPHRFYAK